MCSDLDSVKAATGWLYRSGEDLFDHIVTRDRMGIASTPLERALHALSNGVLNSVVGQGYGPSTLV